MSSMRCQGLCLGVTSAELSLSPCDTSTSQQWDKVAKGAGQGSSSMLKWAQTKELHKNVLDTLKVGHSFSLAALFVAKLKTNELPPTRFQAWQTSKERMATSSGDRVPSGLTIHPGLQSQQGADGVPGLGAFVEGP